MPLVPKLAEFMAFQREDGITEVSEPRLLVASPVVSVHMITYNHENYLTEAIEGVLRQVCGFPFELVIGEDCSTDRTRAIALRFQAEFPERVRVLFSDHNVGPHENLRRVATNCRGKFIAFCEGDDFWCHGRKLELQVRYLEEHADVGAVHTDFHRLVYLQNKWRIKHNAHNKAWCRADQFLAILGAFDTQPCTLMVRKNMYLEHLSGRMFDPEFLVADWPAMIEIAAKSKVGFIPEATAVYRRTPGSLTNSGLRSSLKQARASIKVLENALRMYPIEHKAAQELHVKFAKRLLLMAALDGDRKSGLEATEIIARYEPESLSHFRIQWKMALLRLRPFRAIVSKIICLRTELRELGSFQPFKGIAELEAQIKE